MREWVIRVGEGSRKEVGKGKREFERELRNCKDFFYGGGGGSSCLRYFDFHWSLSYSYLTP